MTAVTHDASGGYFPDGGWGWAVCFASFMIHVIADGIAYSFGIFVEEFVEYFDCGRGYVGMLGSLMLGVTWGTGPIASILTNIYGCRAVSIGGTGIAFIGFMMSIFAPNIYFMFFSFGIVTGVGLGMVYLPAIVSVSFWFEKKRSLATGLAVCGSGIGTFIFAPLTQVLLNEYGWRGTVIVESAILLNCICCGALFRPVENPKCSNEEEKPLKIISANMESSKNVHNTTNIHVPTDDRTCGAAMSLPDVSKAEKTRKRVTSECNSGSQAVQSTSVVSLRKDAFYPRSLQNIPLYNADKQEYHKSMTSVKDQTYDADSSCFLLRCLPPNIRKECGDIIDLSLLLDVSILLFCVSNLLTSIGFCVPYIFLPDRAMKMDWAQEDEVTSRQMSSFLISIVGISNTVGRVVFGWLADRKWVNKLMLYNTVLVLCGIVSIASSLCFNYASIAVYSGLFGLFIGVYVCLTPVVLVDLVGLAKLSTSFGAVLLFQGIGAVVGPPIAGVVFDSTLNYDNSFYLMGVCILVSGLMLYPIPCIRRCQTGGNNQLDLALGKKPMSNESSKLQIVKDLSV